MLDCKKLFKLKKALLKLSEIHTVEGVTLIYNEDELTTGIEVFYETEEGLEPAPNGIYTYENKNITVEGGIITNIAEMGAEVKEEEETAVEEETVTVDEKKEETFEEETPEVEEEVIDEEKEALKAKVAELEALVAELTNKLQEPIAEPVEEEMTERQPKTITHTTKMDYVALVKKARELNKK